MTIKKLKIAVSVLAIAVLTIFTAGSASAATITVSDTTVDLGSTLTVAGTCAVDTTANDVTVTLSSGTNTSVLGTVQADVAGAFTGTFTIPETFPAGTATLTVNCESETGTDNATTTITLEEVVILDAGLNVSDLTPYPGQTVSVTGFCPTSSIGQTATFQFGQEGLTVIYDTSATISSTSTFSASLTIPEGAIVGESAAIVVTCGSTGVENTQYVNIVSAAAVDDIGEDVGGGEEPAIPEGAVDAGIPESSSAAIAFLGLVLVGSGIAVRKLELN